MKRRYNLLAGIAVIGFGAPAASQTVDKPTSDVAPQAGSEAPAPSDDIVVTAQKRSESIQDVPIAVTALTDDQLAKARIDGASNLVLQVPNLNFSRSLFGSNFSIRGVGNQLTATSGDVGVGVHQNYAPLTVEHLADAEFFDLERVEVLRGPQGTLYGRNVTGGVINVITARPKNEFGGYLSVEYGNFDSKRLKGALNLPITNTLAARVAGIFLDRQGYTYNSYERERIDGRHLWSVRGTLQWKPTSDLTIWGLYEHFGENDSRITEAKKLCVKDPGPATVLGVATGANRNRLSQGCQAGSLYQDAAYGAQNTAATILSQLAGTIGLGSGDFLANKVQSRDLREVEKVGRPYYRVGYDHAELNTSFGFAPGLTFSTITSWTRDRTRQRGDSESAIPTVPYASSALFPGGVVNDPQLGATNVTRSAVLRKSDSEQWTQEFRLQSDFAGPLNFTLGGIYIDFNATNQQYIFINQITAVAQVQNRLLNSGIYVDPNFDPNGPDTLGRNYLYGITPYRVESWAGFGELYYKLAPELTFTAGLRYSRDDKSFVYYPAVYLTPGQGIRPDRRLAASFDAWTGLANLEWHPRLSFTDDSMLYASYSRGYKAGGFNSPQAVSALIPATFAPEHVNAYEIGSKNTLANGGLTLNLTGFYYDYSGYQISALVQRTAVNVNLDAKTKGLEFETIVRPVRPLRLNATIGYLDSAIGTSSQLDTLDRTGGNANYVVVKTASSSNCIAPAAGVAAVLTAINNGTLPAATNISGVCAGTFAGAPYNAAPLDGIAKNVTGNDLPNAPRITAALGAELDLPLGRDWNVALRGDYYMQGRSFARIFNSPSDRLARWSNANATLTLSNARWGLDATVFARNLFNKDTIVGSSLTDDIFGLTRAVFLLDPRIYGVSLKKTF